MGQQNSCNILIGAHSIMHLMHPINYCLYVCKFVKCAFVCSCHFSNSLAIATAGKGVTRAPVGKSLYSNTCYIQLTTCSTFFKLLTHSGSDVYVGKRERESRVLSRKFFLWGGEEAVRKDTRYT